MACASTARTDLTAKSAKDAKDRQEKQRFCGCQCGVRKGMDVCVYNGDIARHTEEYVFIPQVRRETAHCCVLRALSFDDLT